MCGGGAALFGTLVAALLGGARPARAEEITGTVPEVDRLAVRVVIDSYQIAVAPSTNRLRKNSPHHEEVAGIRSESFDGAQSLP